MTREIKFRAWHNPHKEMIYNPNVCVVVLQQELPEWELMQYTGLKDKNGVEIYEGDIVKTTVGKHLWWYLVTTNTNFGGNNLYLITRYRNFRHIDSGDDIEWGDFFVNERRDTLTEYDANKNFEVIGNIYENPELLKEA